MKLLRITPIALIILVFTTGAFARPHAHGGVHLSKSKQKENVEKTEEMTPMCKAMMAVHGEMEEKKKAMDMRLSKKVIAMETATDDKRIDLMSEVIHELVMQRQEMHTQMLGGMHNMMGHMMNHMQAGMMMSECPMMKQMMGGAGAVSTDDEHSKHGH